MALIMSPSWRVVPEVGSTSHAWQGKWRNMCHFCLQGLFTEVLVFACNSQHLKIRCETVAEGRQGSIAEVYCAERVGGDEHDQKCLAHFRRGFTVSKDTLACGVALGVPL